MNKAIVVAVGALLLGRAHVARAAELAGHRSYFNETVFPQAPAEPDGSGPLPPRPSESWDAFRIEGAHALFGMSLALGVTHWRTDSDIFEDGEARREHERRTRLAFLYSIHFGYLFERFEVSIEIAPMTWLPLIDDIGKPTFGGLLNFGYLIPLSGDAYWVLRLGVGAIGVNADRLSPGGQSVWSQLRADVFAVAIPWGHLLFEFSIPSLRWATDLSEAHLFSFTPALRTTYVF